MSKEIKVLLDENTSLVATVSFSHKHGKGEKSPGRMIASERHLA